MSSPVGASRSAKLAALGLALAAASLALAPAVRAQADRDAPAAGGLEALRVKVQAAMADVKTTRGKFRQTKKLALFDDKVESSGTFSIERPDRLRWEIEKPFRSILTISGDKGARWNETRKAVERFALADKPGIDVAVKQLFSWYQGKFDDLQSQFTATVGADGRTVALVPKSEKVREVLEKISIRLAPDAPHDRVDRLEEKEGDRTDIAFSDVEINPTLAEKTFQIEDR